MLAREHMEPEDSQGLCARLGELGMIGLGRVRARWTLHDGPYLPREAVDPRLLCDLLLAVGLIERRTGSRAHFGIEDGVVEFRQDNLIIGCIVVASGRGIRRWLSLEASPDSIVSGPTAFEMFGVDEIRHQHDIVSRMFT